MEIKDLFDRWNDGQIIEYNLDKHNLSQAGHFFATRAKEIYHEAESNADQAFADLLQLVVFINTISRKKPDILGKLAELVEELKKALKRIAEKKLADSYSISAGFPLGVSVGLSWNITPTEGTDA